MMEKDIFGNVYEVKGSKQMSYAQKLKEMKAKKKYNEYKAMQRKETFDSIKRGAQRSKVGVQKIGARTKRATQKSGIKGKLYYALKGKTKTIYPKE